jgi:hypothetical protein
MIKLTKMSRAKFWHIKQEEIDETLCGVPIKTFWMLKERSIENIPIGIICTECLAEISVSEVDMPVQADKTHAHYTW